MTFHSVGNGNIIPTDVHSIIFQMGRLEPPTSNIYSNIPPWLTSDFPLKRVIYPLKIRCLVICLSSHQEHEAQGTWRYLTTKVGRCTPWMLGPMLGPPHPLQYGFIMLYHCFGRVLSTICILGSALPVISRYDIYIYIYGYESKYKVWIKAPNPHTIHTPRSIP